MKNNKDNNKKDYTKMTQKELNEEIELIKQTIGYKVYELYLSKEIETAYLKQLKEDEEIESSKKELEEIKNKLDKTLEMIPLTKSSLKKIIEKYSHETSGIGLLSQIELLMMISEINAGEQKDRQREM